MYNGIILVGLAILLIAIIFVLFWCLPMLGRIQINTCVFYAKSDLFQMFKCGKYHLPIRQLHLCVFKPIEKEKYKIQEFINECAQEAFKHIDKGYLYITTTHKCFYKRLLKNHKNGHIEILNIKYDNKNEPYIKPIKSKYHENNMRNQINIIYQDVEDKPKTPKEKYTIIFKKL